MAVFCMRQFDIVLDILNKHQGITQLELSVYFAERFDSIEDKVQASDRVRKRLSDMKKLGLVFDSSTAGMSKRNCTVSGMPNRFWFTTDFLDKQVEK